MVKGIRLKQLRIKISLSQTEAARRLGISKQTLYKYEKEIVTNIPSDVVEHMAKLYETTPAYIMGWTDDPNKTAEDLLKEAYIKSAETKEFIDLFQNATPEAQSAAVLVLKSQQQKPGLPHLH